jgi:hypothetical protein
MQQWWKFGLVVKRRTLTVQVQGNMDRLALPTCEDLWVGVGYGASAAFTRGVVRKVIRAKVNLLHKQFINGTYTDQLQWLNRKYSHIRGKCRRKQKIIF